MSPVSCEENFKSTTYSKNFLLPFYRIYSQFVHIVEAKDTEVTFCVQHSAKTSNGQQSLFILNKQVGKLLVFYVNL